MMDPNEVSQVAGAALMTLSGAEAVLGKMSFASLLTATSLYEYKVSAAPARLEHLPNLSTFPRWPPRRRSSILFEQSH
jgi:hypothetical protein